MIVLKAQFIPIGLLLNTQSNRETVGVLIEFYTTKLQGQNHLWPAQRKPAMFA